MFSRNATGTSLSDDHGYYRRGPLDEYAATLESEAFERKKRREIEGRGIFRRRQRGPLVNPLTFDAFDGTRLL